MASGNYEFFLPVRRRFLSSYVSARFEREDSDMQCFNLATFPIEYPRGGRWRSAIMICNIAHMQER
jgi:hypothetical protein